MFQLTSQSDAIQAARLLAVRDMLPVLVMESIDHTRCSIATTDCELIRSQGYHVATVHPSGQVDRECLRSNWLHRWLGNACRCEGRGKS